MKKIKCLECNKEFIRPMAHVWQVHKISARDYKEIHGLDVKKGIMCEEAKEVMREHVRKNKTIENLKSGFSFRFKKGESRPYKRSEQTMTRLKEHWKKFSNLAGRPVTIPKIEIKCALCQTPKMIPPRQFQENNNYCGVRCRNINNNNKRNVHDTNPTPSSAEANRLESE